jgi:outer membrane biosynthesis protein TonB
MRTLMRLFVRYPAWSTQLTDMSRDGMVRPHIHELCLAKDAYSPRVRAFTEDHRCYRPSVSRSPILPLAAAVTAVALGASPALAAPLSPGKRDEVKVVAFPLFAAKGQAPASLGSHVSHSSHVSGSGGHVSHVSHLSHVSSVPAPVPTTAPVAPPPTTAAPPPPPATTTPPPSPSQSPIPTASLITSVPPVIAPTQDNQPSSPAVVTSASPTTSSGHGCAFVLVAPFGAIAGGIRRFARRRSSP